MNRNKQKMAASLKVFILSMVFVVIGLTFLFAAIWLSTGDDTARYLSTAAVVGIPAVVGAIASGVEYWES